MLLKIVLIVLLFLGINCNVPPQAPNIAVGTAPNIAVPTIAVVGTMPCLKEENKLLPHCQHHAVVEKVTAELECYLAVSY